MELDETKIDEAVLALLYLTLSPRDHRAWKSFDRDAMNRLHEKGFILNPASKTKSVVLTKEGEALAKQLAHKMFGKD
jgi:hypothetical protein